MGVSKNSGTPKSSISIDSIGFSIINHPFWSTTISGNTQIGKPVAYTNTTSACALLLIITFVSSSVEALEVVNMSVLIVTAGFKCHLFLIESTSDSTPRHPSFIKGLSQSHRGTIHEICTKCGLHFLSSSLNLLPQMSTPCIANSRHICSKTRQTESWNGNVPAVSRSY